MFRHTVLCSMIIVLTVARQLFDFCQCQGVLIATRIKAHQTCSIKDTGGLFPEVNQPEGEVTAHLNVMTRKRMSGA